MEGEMTTPLEQAVAHIRAGNIATARAILIEILKRNSRDENAWMCMTLCVTEVEQKKYCFQKVLKINPQNQHALAGLARLHNPVPSPAQSPVIEEPIGRKVIRFSMLTLGTIATGVVLVILCLYILLFMPPGP
jgi:hypothetical protein